MITKFCVSERSRFVKILAAEKFYEIWCTIEGIIVAGCLGFLLKGANCCETRAKRVRGFGVVCISAVLWKSLQRFEFRYGRFGTRLERSAQMERGQQRWHSRASRTQV